MQIFAICTVEIQGIADGEVAKGIIAYNPIMSGQLTREEIELSSKDENRPLNLKSYDVEINNEDKKLKGMFRYQRGKINLIPHFG